MGNGNFRKDYIVFFLFIFLGEFKIVLLVSIIGLVIEIGLVKVDFRLEERDFDLCFILLVFYVLGYMGRKNKLVRIRSR